MSFLNIEASQLGILYAWENHYYFVSDLFIVYYFLQTPLHLLLSTIISVTNINGILIAYCLYIENY